MGGTITLSKQLDVKSTKYINYQRILQAECSVFKWSRVNILIIYKIIFILG